MSRLKVYAVYKGDTFVDLGTAKELGEKLSIHPKTIQWHATPTAEKRRKDYRNQIIVIPIEDIEEDIIQ